MGEPFCHPPTRRSREKFKFMNFLKIIRRVRTATRNENSRQVNETAINIKIIYGIDRPIYSSLIECRNLQFCMKYLPATENGIFFFLSRLLFQTPSTQLLFSPHSNRTVENVPITLFFFLLSYALSDQICTYTSTIETDTAWKFFIPVPAVFFFPLFFSCATQKTERISLFFPK